MTLSLNQAQDIVGKLSNEQLMQAYTSGTIPQFVVFSEMQRRQQMQNAGAKMPTQTVAEKMVGKEEGIPAALPSPPQGMPHPQAHQVPPPQGMPSQPPQMAARGGMTKNSTLSTGSRFISPDELNMLKMRYQDMEDMASPMEYAEGGEVESPITNKDIARMIMPSLINVESGGRQGAVSNKGATGVAQLMPNTAPEAARMAGLPWDPAKYKNDASYNSTLGHAYLTSMLDRFGDREKALAAYNAGPGRLSSALQKEKETGRPWMSFMPRETQAYVPKVLSGAQAKLPSRQDPEGADVEQPPFGHDPAFGGGTMAYSGFQYPGKDQPSDVDRGLAAIMAAQKVQGLRFAEGSEDEPVSADGDYTPMPSFEDRLKRAVLQKKIEEAQSSKMKEPSFLDKVRGSFKPPQDLSTMVFGARDPEQDKDARPQEILPTPSQIHGSGYSEGPRPTPKLEPFNKPEAPYQYTSEGTIGDTYVYDRPKTETPDQPPVGIASVGGSSPFTGSEPPLGSPDYRKAEEEARALKEKDAALRGPSAGGSQPAPKGGEDMSFNAVMKQVQDAIGSKVPDEFAEGMKKHQEVLASMKNDKIVDALFAAAKTLAGQRVGQQNFGDAVANAGLAAQEAQKRIYKAEDDMRKYRAELLKAQDDNNYKAASIAMNKIVQAEHDKKSLQIAAMQAEKSYQAAVMTANRDDARLVASEKRQQERLDHATTLARRKEISAEIGKAEDLIRTITPRPDKVDLDPEGTKKRIAEAQGNIVRLKKELQGIGGTYTPQAPAGQDSPDYIRELYGLK